MFSSRNRRSSRGTRPSHRLQRRWNGPPLIAEVLEDRSLLSFIITGPLTNNEGDVLNLATSNDPPTYTFTQTGLPSGLSIGLHTGVITGTIGLRAARTAPYAVMLQATAPGAATETLNFDWTVTDNTLPTVNPVAAQTNLVGDTVSLQVTGSDADDDALKFVASGLPPGLTMNLYTGLISGTLTPQSGRITPYAVKVNTSDGFNISPAFTFNWTIQDNTVPVITPLQNQTNYELDPISIQFLATDSSNAPLTYSAKGLPAGVSINATTGLISGTLTGQSAKSTPYSVTVKAANSWQSSTSVFNWTVIDNTVPAVTPIPDQTSNVGGTVSFQVTGSDAFNDPLKFVASGLPPGLMMNLYTGLISGILTPQSGRITPYSVKVNTSDGFNISPPLTFNWTIQDNTIPVITPLQDQTNYEMDPISIQVLATDASNAPLTYSAKGLPAGVSINATTGLITGTLTGQSAKSTPYSVTVKAANSWQSSTSDFNWTVIDNTVPAVTPAAAQTNLVGDTVSLQVNGTDAYNDPLKFVASGLPPGLTMNLYTGLISGTLTPQSGRITPYAVKVNTSDGFNISPAFTFNWTIQDNTVPVITPLQNQTNYELDPISIQFLATDSSNAPLTYSAKGLPAGVSINATTGLISGTLTGQSAKSTPYSVTVKAANSWQSSTSVFNWTVIDNTVPAVTPIANQTNNVGDTVSFQVTGTDAYNDPLKFAAAGLPPGLTMNLYSGLISGTLMSQSASRTPYAVRVYVSDGFNTSPAFTFNWTVKATAPPTVSPLPDQTNFVGDVVSLQVVATDGSNIPLIFSAIGLPQGVSINPVTGLITGSPNNQSFGSSYTAIVSADNGTLIGTTSFQWNINGTQVVGHYRVSTYHNDNASTGQDLQETTLTPSNVNQATFGKILSTATDGYSFGQPLYMPGVNITSGPFQGTHNVVYVATEHDTVYAIDADTGTVLWKISALVGPYLPANAVITTVPAADVKNSTVGPEVGITSTPVIDTSSNTLYFVAMSREIYGGDTHYVFRMHAVDLGSGAEKFGGPTLMADTIYNGSTIQYVSGPWHYGNGAGRIPDPQGSGRQIVPFLAIRELQRAALTLANGQVYAAFASYSDNGPYHGWVLGYSASNLKPTAVFDVCPNGAAGGIWQSGGGLAVDSQGNLYFMSGNGDFEEKLNAQGFPILGDYGDSFVKLSVDPSTTAANQNINGWGLKVVDYFTPSNQQALDDIDADLGSGGPMLLPDAANFIDANGASHQVLVGAGKEGRVYFIDANNMGHFDPSGDHVLLQELVGAFKGSFSVPSYFNGTLYYIPAYGDVAKTYDLTQPDHHLPSQATTTSAANYPYPGATVSISANGTANGIVWVLENAFNLLVAYPAGDFAHPLYDSGQAGGRDTIGSSVKFQVPTIANGRVYVANAGSLTIFGLFGSSSTAPAAPTGLATAVKSSSQVILSWQDHSNNETGFKLERSTDGVNFTQVAVLPANQSTYTDAGLASGTKYSYRLRATNGAGDSAYTNIAFGTTLPGTWNDTDVGISLASGSASSPAAGSFVVSGSGPDIGGAVDSFNFLYLPLSGDGSIVTKVSGFQASDPLAKAGLMIRGSLANNVPFVDLVLTPGLGVVMQSRSSIGAVATPPIQGPAEEAPYWLKLTRVGNTITGFASEDGNSFTQVASYTIAMGANVNIGLLVNSHVDGVLATAKFDNVSAQGAIPTAPAAPTGLSVKGAGVSQINLTWTDNATNETGYKVERSNNGVTFTQIALLNPGATSFSDTTLFAGNRAYYRIRATNAQGDSPYSNTANTTTTAAGGTAFVSDLSFASSTNGLGSVNRDTSAGGSTLTINGTTFPKGLGVVANSDVVLNLGGSYATFLANIGIDAEVGAQGAVIFQIFADGTKVYDSGGVTGGQAAQSVNLSVAGVTSLDLRVIDAGGTAGTDHADWANARLVAVSAPPVAPTGLTATVVSPKWAWLGSTILPMKRVSSFSNRPTVSISPRSPKLCRGQPLSRWATCCQASTTRSASWRGMGSGYRRQQPRRGPPPPARPVPQASTSQPASAASAVSSLSMGLKRRPTRDRFN